MVLKTKILTVIALVLLLSVGVSTVIILRLQSDKIISSGQKDAEAISEVILRSVEDDMSMGDSSAIQRMVEHIGQSKELQNLRILSTDGYILKSKNFREIGERSTNYAHIKAVGSGKAATIPGDSFITLFIPIENKRQCNGCHSPSNAINGVLEVKYDISRHYDDLKSLKRYLIILNMATVMAVALFVSYLVSRLILKPVNQFIGAIKEVESGNWDARVAFSEGDELGELGGAFNRMVEKVGSLYERDMKKSKEISRARTELDHKRQLEELNRHLEYKIKEVETSNKAVLSLSKEVKDKNITLEKTLDRMRKLYDIGSALTSIIETNDLLKLVVSTTAEMLDARRGFVRLERTDDRSIGFAYSSDFGAEDISGTDAEPHPHFRELMQNGRTIFLSNHNHSLKGAPVASPTIGVPLLVRGQIVGGMIFEEKTDQTHFTSEDLDLLASMANQAMVAIENASLYETVKSNYFGTIQSLVNALEANDRYTKGHSERVKTLAVELARMMGLEYTEIETLEHAAILHDIGKIGIDSSVLNKRDRLSSDELNVIMAHPLIGDEILGPIGTFENVRETIIQHHERYDGTGYPYGIAGEEICLKARILSVVDTFDAMRTDRPYRRALSMDTAVDEIRRGAGTQFDPYVVNTFMEMIGKRSELFSFYSPMDRM